MRRVQQCKRQKQVPQRSQSLGQLSCVPAPPIPDVNGDKKPRESCEIGRTLAHHNFLETGRLNLSVYGPAVAAMLVQFPRQLVCGGGVHSNQDDEQCGH